MKFWGRKKKSNPLYAYTGCIYTTQAPIWDLPHRADSAAAVALTAWLRHLWSQGVRMGYGPFCLPAKSTPSLRGAGSISDKEQRNYLHSLLQGNVVNLTMLGPELSSKWPPCPASDKGSRHSRRDVGREGELPWGGTTDRTRMGLGGQGGAGSAAWGLRTSKDTRIGVSW